jgi:hypothetical protein
MSLIHPTHADDITTANSPTVLVPDGVSDAVPDGVSDHVPDGVSDGKLHCEFSL